MIIRNDHIDAMMVLDIAHFLERAIEFLYENFPDSLDEDSDELSETVGYLIEKADSYSLATRQQVMTYIVSGWLLGKDFDMQFPAAQDTLSSEDFLPDEKTDWLTGWTEEMFAVMEN